MAGPAAAGLAAGLAAGVLALLYETIWCRAEPGAVRSVAKTGSVLLLALAAWLAAGPWALIAALLLCAAGDYLLSRGGAATFMAGVAAFAAGHLAYVILFIGHPSAQPARLLAFPQAMAIAALALLGLAMAALLWRRAGALRLAVMLYIPIILSMAVAVMVLPPEGALRLALPAALSFVASDTLLATERFLLPEEGRIGRILPHVLWPLYWLAQAGFVLAFVPGFGAWEP